MLEDEPRDLPVEVDDLVGDDVAAAVLVDGGAVQGDEVAAHILEAEVLLPQVLHIQQKQLNRGAEELIKTNAEHYRYCDIQRQQNAIFLLLSSV